MKIIFLQNTIRAGRRYGAGESIEVSIDEAKHLEAMNLAYVEKPIEFAQTAQIEPVATPEAKPKATRRRRASTQKAAAK